MGRVQVKCAGMHDGWSRGGADGARMPLREGGRDDGTFVTEGGGRGRVVVERAGTVEREALVRLSKSSPEQWLKCKWSFQFEPVPM